MESISIGVACGLAIVGCGAHAAHVEGPPPSVTDDGEVQAQRGAGEFAEHCASCHGDKGEGSSKAPPLIGEGALPKAPRSVAKKRTGEFATALDVAKFVTQQMPADAPGSLSEADYWDVLAYVLKANGIAVAGKHLDATTAAALPLR